MKNYRDSDYAANKYASGIVYRFADQTVEVTLEDYLRENPSKTKADFDELKALSDEMYLEQARDENRQTYKDVSLYGLDETDLCAVPSPEEMIIDQTEQAAKKKRRRELAKRALATLTEIQRRRYIWHTVKGLSTRQIAEREGTNQKSVYESLLAAEKKIKKALSNG